MFAHGEVAQFRAGLRIELGDAQAGGVQQFDGGHGGADKVGQGGGGGF